ncbi:MAG: hypothetical protein EH225_06965 [Calditrichaeota bacterium]|nr:hypothetical protein [Calditrichota bacterium]RQV92991.1 MAG: hypothetical protein EH221_10485 [bacterium]RQW03544.1 MAG: hypothetical protein EH225_06965 [Calditrichota bacterium]
MSYKLRNIIVLGSLCFLLVAVGAYIVGYYYPKKITQLEKQIANMKNQISNLAGVEEEYQNIDKVISEKQQRLANLNKRVVPAVTPSESYRYLISILKYSGMLDFDMLFQGTEKKGRYSYNIYNIKGEGPFHKIYEFITYLEKGPYFYRIENLNLHMVENKDKETKRYQVIIPFEMEIWALFAEVPDLPPIKRTLASVRVPRASNPFYPYVYQDLPDNVDNLPEVERADLKAIVKDKVFIADAEGIIHELKEGDKVYLGYLKTINEANNEANFILNKGGIVEEFSLHIRFGEETKP